MSAWAKASVRGVMTSHGDGSNNKSTDGGKNLVEYCPGKIRADISKIVVHPTNPDVN